METQVLVSEVANVTETGGMRTAEARGAVAIFEPSFMKRFLVPITRIVRAVFYGKGNLSRPGGEGLLELLLSGELEQIRFPFDWYRHSLPS